jgi:hypothetical protein
MGRSSMIFNNALAGVKWDMLRLQIARLADPYVYLRIESTHCEWVPQVSSATPAMMSKVPAVFLRS